jgi:hypothetical protein
MPITEFVLKGAEEIAGTRDSPPERIGPGMEAAGALACIVARRTLPAEELAPASAV